MSSTRLSRRRRRRAFTIVEILATTVVVGILATVATMKYKQHLEKMNVSRAILDLQGMTFQISVMDPLPASLAEIGKADLKDPWGNPYEYLRFDLSGGGDPPGARKDRSLHPLNSFFDLYSKGPDGASDLPLTSARSRDDIIVASDGKYVGIAEGY
jgi:general secretion pathway protein G